MNAAVFEAKGLTRRFGNRVALDKLNLSVGSGDVVCLLGANGAGKTTTINLFLGFLEPTEGEALSFGLSPIRDRNAALARLAYVPETVSLYPNLSGIENLALLSEIGGRRLSRSALEAHLETGGLNREDFDRRASDYSKGMRQKVLLAAAYARDADAWLLDEPFSGLDPSAAGELARAIRRRADAGGSVLMVTHDLFRARELATRIGIMREGKLLEMIDPARLTHADLESLYLRHVEGTA